MARLAESVEGRRRLDRLEDRVDHRLAEHIETHDVYLQMAAAGQAGLQVWTCVRPI